MELIKREKIITFIIPAYNSQTCLNKCLDSFLISEEYFEELEVIVINDGSTDRTSQIAQEYVNRFPDAYRLINKENGGHGSAINVGTREATGKYLKVIDADDWVETKNLPVWMDILRENNADVVLTPFHMVDFTTGSKNAWQMYCDDYRTPVALDNIISEWGAFERCMTFHGITYRTNFYNQYRHELTEKVFYEDWEYAAIPCCMAKSILPVDIFIYQYLVGNDSQSISDSNRIRRISHTEQVTESLLNYWNTTRDLTGAAREYLFRKIRALVLSHYDVVCLVQKDKPKGRANAKRYYDMICRLAPVIGQRIKKEFRIYMLLNRLHISHSLYLRLLHIFKCIRGTYKAQKE